MRRMKLFTLAAIVLATLITFTARPSEARFGTLEVACRDANGNTSPWMLGGEHDATDYLCASGGATGDITCWERINGPNGHTERYSSFLSCPTAD